MTRITRKGITWLGGLALVVGMTTAPQRATAGDEEWATAGKILTGVVGLYALNHVVNDRPSYNGSYRSGPSYSTNYYSTSYRSSGYRDYHGSHHRSYRQDYPRHERYSYYSYPRYQTYTTYTTYRPAPAPQVVYNYHVTQPAPAPVQQVYYTRPDDGGDYYTPRDSNYYAVASQPEAAPRRVVVERQPQTEIVIRDERRAEPQPQWQPAPQPEPQRAQAPQPRETAQPATRDVQNADEANYVVASIGDDRRIVQPRVKGAEAMLQQYSEVHDRWIDVKTYPSIY